jgi:hypothetical protein
MLMSSTYKLSLAEAIDPTMIWTMVLIFIVVMLLIFGRRLLLLAKGKTVEEDLDEDEFIMDEDETTIS